MKIIGYHHHHDAAWCTLEDGIVTKHVELERVLRTKEPMGNPIHAYMFEREFVKPDVAVSCYPQHLSRDIHITSVLDTIGIDKVHLYSHHLAHAAHAFYSSQMKDALIFTIDGGGIDDERGNEITTGVYHGHDNKVDFVGHFPGVNVGTVWSRATRFIFRLESGFPQGNCCGTVMALAAFGDSQKYIGEIRTWFNGETNRRVCQAPEGHVKGMSAKDPRSPKHPYIGKFEYIAKSSFEETCNIAASLQLVTEEYIYNIMLHAGVEKVENVCVSGGVALNSLMTGKIQKWFPNVKNVFVPPVPYDGGLCLGCCSYHWHHILDNQRIYTSHSFSPYMGNSYTESDVLKALDFYKDKVEVNSHALRTKANCCTVSKGVLKFNRTTDDLVIDMLLDQKIVSIFQGRSECGRRALGNRSIVADPRSLSMKDLINEKVKHRQAFRPFAPSVLKEKANEWFEGTIDSPYMGFTANVKEEKRNLIPAVIHVDGTARLQTVEKETNPFWHKFLTLWEQKSGVPILLNTSQNDRSPIVDSPDDAVRCFLGTDIDALYFPEFRIIVTKRETK